MRVALGRLLRLAGYEVDTFESGAAFLASLVTVHPACAIVDVHMPSLSGLELQARLRVSRDRLPLILITASDDPGLGAIAHAAGAVCLLRKPFSSDELLAAVAAALADAGSTQPN